MRSLAFIFSVGLLGIATACGTGGVVKPAPSVRESSRDGSSVDSSVESPIRVPVGSGDAAAGVAPTDGGTAADSASAKDGGSGGEGDSGSGSGGPRVNPSPTGPFPVVADCTALPSPSSGWQDITPPVFVTPTWEAVGVVVDPYDQSVYAAAGSGPGNGSGVQRSTDCGKTWKLQSTGRNAAKIKTGSQWAMKIVPQKDGPPTLYVTNGYGNDPTIYKSTNGAVDFDPLEPDSEGVVVKPTWVHSLSMDPNDGQHIAVAFHDNCHAPRRPLCFSRSGDGGRTWQMFDGPSEAKGWEEGASINALGPTSYLYIGNSGTFATTDTGASWKQVGTTPVYCCYGGITTMLPDGSVVASFGTGLWTSKASGSTPIGAEWTLLKNSPTPVVSVIHDGERLFVGAGYFMVGQPYYSAPLSDLSKWSAMPTPDIARSPNQMAYDPVHHIVYSVNWQSGVWRLVTR
ncbi:MAG: hypothetical protein RLZZ450_5647 [Pseudomonadota bacterium]|jgi:photosystem II stability/assembly factor-like uncharacterized protein